jgi:hypothetical protein
MISDIGLDSRSLAEELASAIHHESLPRMLRSLLQTALTELRAQHEGTSGRGLAIARFAVAEWRRWRLEPWGLD